MERGENYEDAGSPNILRLHRAINDQCFVCIVLDLVKGGDMMEGMINHWEKKGQIPFDASTRVTRQILAGMAFMHTANIIHRDVKCDNLLCDLQDISDPNQRVRLADFGTALKLKSSDDRMDEHCGTKQYWAPEFYRLNYSLPVDVWAVGVCLWGLLVSSWPFKSKQDVFSKVLKFDPNWNIPPLLQELVWAMCTRDEKKRQSCAELLDHPLFLGKGVEAKKIVAVGANQNLVSALPQTGRLGRTSVVMNTKLSEAEEDNFAVFDDNLDMKGGQDLGVQLRRQELVGRMNERERKDKKGKKKKTEHFRTDFNILDKQAQNSVFRYEWWPEQKACDVLEMDQTAEIGITPSTDFQDTSVPVITQMLRKHGIDVKQFGQGRAHTIQKFADELETGKSVLMLDAANHRKLVRVVDLVCLRIYSPRGQYLIDCGEELKDGREIGFHRLPGLKKLPYENSKQTATRLLRMIGEAVGQVDIDWECPEMFEEEELSQSYPGVFTVYRKEILNGAAGTGGGGKTIRWSEAMKVDLSGHDENVNSRSFKWMTPAKCKAAGVILKAPATAQDRGDCLVQGDIGLNAKDLRKFLTAAKIDVSKFGQDNAKSIEDVAAELQKGECSLATHPDGGVVRVVDVVLLKMEDSTRTMVLVQAQKSFPDGKVVLLNRLPGMKRRPDESHFITARKIVARQLKIPENYVVINAAKVAVKEEVTESLAYPGLSTVYRKRVISAQLELGAAGDGDKSEAVTISITGGGVLDAPASASEPAGTPTTSPTGKTKKPKTLKPSGDSNSGPSTGKVKAKVRRSRGAADKLPKE